MLADKLDVVVAYDTVTGAPSEVPVATRPEDCCEYLSVNSIFHLAGHVALPSSERQPLNDKDSRQWNKLATACAHAFKTFAELQSAALCGYSES